MVIVEVEEIEKSIDDTEIEREKERERMGNECKLLMKKER